MKYRVHSAGPCGIPVKAKTDDGVEVDATVPGLAVELLPVDGVHTVTLTVRQSDFPGQDLTALFALDNILALSLTLVAD